MNVVNYRALFSRSREQPAAEIFAHFYPFKDPLTKKADYDYAFKAIAAKTLEGSAAWEFTQQKFRDAHRAQPPKLRNYLGYTFIRLRDLEIQEPEQYFLMSEDGNWACFNTGLQDKHAADLYAVFNRYEPHAAEFQNRPSPDWVYRGTLTSREHDYRSHFGLRTPKLAWYSTDSRDYIFNTEYQIDTDIFEHMFDRAKERSGFAEDATNESVQNYLRGSIENLIPKIRRNYKTAIPMYYVQERRMQMLLPFHSSNGKDISCFLVERDDVNRCYKIKTILDMDQAYFAARLLTRPDKEWLNP